MSFVKRELERLQEEESENQRTCGGCTLGFDEDLMAFSANWYGEGKSAWFCATCAEKVGLKP